MTQTNETFDTSSAAKTGSSPTFLVAMEQYEPPAQRIIHDDLAAKVLSGGERFFLKLMRIPLLRKWMINLSEKQVEGASSAFLCRKRYIDETIVAVAEKGSVAAIVNLGAGFDTRVYRLPALATIPAWEVDQPVNIEAKQKGLHNALGTIPPHVTLVPINFMTQDLGAVLNEHGYTGDKQTFFIWEAVTQYLTETAVRETFQYLAQAPTGSQLTFTYVLKDFIEGKNVYGAEKIYERMIVKDNIWHFGFDPAEVADFLAEYGWRLIEDLSYEELNHRYAKSIGRNLPSMKIERMVYAEKI
ncbi:MAG: class I SAM-dependent methyltransferase [Chloroflexi bacterium]|nr:class I SAM-dependent methyltransferase [Chloroflexota bacterium]